MLTATSTVEIPGVSPQEVLEFVLDLERYRDADHKIVKVETVTGPDESGRGSIKLSGKLRYGPAAPDGVLVQRCLSASLGLSLSAGRERRTTS